MKRKKKEEQHPTTESLIDRKYLSKKDYIWFSAARFAASSITGMAQGYLLFFYTSIMGIPMLSVGTMFLVARIFDGLNDPIMGVLVDKTRTRWGKMRPYLIFASIPWCALVILLFINWSGFTETGKIIYMYATYLSYGLLGTIIGIPLDGLPAVASPNVQERTRLISISRILGSVGEQSALVLISVGLILTNSNYEATYTGSAVIIGLIAPVLLIGSGLTLKARLEPTSERPKVIDGFKYMFKNKPFLALISANLLTFFRNLVSASIIYVVCYIYGNGSLQIAFALPGAIAAMVGMMLAPSLKKRFNAKQLFIGATIWHSAALILIYPFGITTPWYVIAALMFFAMMPVGILNVVPHLMAADTVDYWEHKTGQRQEGITYSLMSLRSKISSGFKDYFLTFLLAFFLFSQPLSTVDGHMPVQSLYTQNGLFAIYTVIPALLNLVSIIPMLFYNLTGERIRKVQEELAERREKSLQEAAAEQQEVQNEQA
ncbi:MAG: glycoside-pentoside-hexuronide (GPH):cation symporter [Clostridiales bacterium]|nr:glycoside-pentoside-hexuronide (GPH):cation symporter [Clostridiales bacterium]